MVNNHLDITTSAVLDIQLYINKELDKLSEWNVTLHFLHIEGRLSDEVDLYCCWTTFHAENYPHFRIQI